MKKIILMVLFTKIAFASVPVQGLFQNPSNPEMKESLKISVDIKAGATSQRSAELFLKKNGREIWLTEFGENNTNRFVESPKNKVNDFIFAVMSVAFMNDAQNMTDFLNKNCSLNIDSKSMIDKESVSALNASKKNLANLKNANLNDNERNKLTKILSKSIYRKDKDLKLVKKDEEFVLEYKNACIRAEFENENYKLILASYKDELNNVEIILSSYLTYNGVYQSPKLLEIKMGEKDQFTIEIKKIDYLSDLQWAKEIDLAKKRVNNSGNVSEKGYLPLLSKLDIKEL
jgi:hypothetical protein